MWELACSNLGVWVEDGGKTPSEGDFFTTVLTNSQQSRMSIFFWDENGQRKAKKVLFLLPCIFKVLNMNSNNFKAAYVLLIAGIWDSLVSVCLG